MATAECPYCDYQGSIRSVEGHVSGSQSGDHEGKVGREVRDQLRSEVESDMNGGPDHGKALILATLAFVSFVFARAEEGSDGA